MIRYFILFIVFLIFSLKGIVFLDPDFGWHLKVGEMIQKTGIPVTDPFSYTMPDYHFVDHEWLTDVLLSKLYPYGNIGLSAIFSLLAVAAILIQIPAHKRRFAGIPALLAVASIFSPSGVRPQVITWFFLSVIVKIVFDQKLWSKWRFFVPFLFLIWANMHGGFIIGLALIFLIVILKFLSFIKLKLELIKPNKIQNSKFKIQNYSLKFKINKEKKLLTLNCNFALCTLHFELILPQNKIAIQIRQDVLILFLSFVATLINPYGINLWKEVWVSMSDGSLRWSIAEWLPSILNLDFALWVYLPFSVVLILRYRKKFKFAEIFLYSLFLLMGLSSIRNMPLWVIVSLPMTIFAVYFLYEEAKSKKGGALRFDLAYKVFLIIALIFSSLQIFLVLNNSKSLSEDSFYPKKAVGFLKTHETSGQIFSQYGWGGYLIWKYPSKKVFIDGRMPSWRDKNNYAFRDYQDIFEGKIEFKQISKKYNIDTVLLPVQKPVKSQSGIINNLNEAWNRFIERFTGKRIYPEIYAQLKKDGWKVVYEDKVAVVYRK